MSQGTAPPLIATYRVQLRNGVDLDAVRARIPWFRRLGISHIYLSPLFAATSGSTHGYDVIDPNKVDERLGGEEAFQALSRAARDADLGIVLDIVPNHMAFAPENPYLADVMRHGPDSRFAGVFDIDWSKGPLHFPILDKPPCELLRDGQIALEGQALRIYGQLYPLRAPYLQPLTDFALETILAGQFWRLGHWRDSAHAIVHRRFFNISSLVGVRQEDPEVFALTHRWIIAQVEAGRVQGLRVDHVDGLARPGDYLRRLRDAVGIVPIWIEKIVKEGETFPASWPVQGMSGYEFMAPVTQLLTETKGLARLRKAAAGDVPPDIPAEIRAIRQKLLEDVFSPELGRTTDVALQALAADRSSVPKIRAAIAGLALVWPVYRSYAGDKRPLGAAFHHALMQARASNPANPFLGAVHDLLGAVDEPAAREFASRFEQLTGALTAKSEEDTLFFRSVAYLPFCEVGAEPDLSPIAAEDFAALVTSRLRNAPCALTALTTHDTKRSADARAAVIALSYQGDLAERLYRKSAEEAAEARLRPRWGIYGLQVALMMYDQPDRASRIAEHLAKAMREAKEDTSHEDPDSEIENRAAALTSNLATRLETGRLWTETERLHFETNRRRLILAQVALQLTAPGIPDVYQGTEILSVTLTDPDNRARVDWKTVEEGLSAIDREKRLLTRQLLARRSTQPDLFALGNYCLDATERHWIVKRRWQEQSFEFMVERPAHAELEMSCAGLPRMNEQGLGQFHGRNCFPFPEFNGYALHSDARGYSETIFFSCSDCGGWMQPGGRAWLKLRVKRRPVWRDSTQSWQAA